jgi:hypothetical protein
MIAAALRVFCCMLILAAGCGACTPGGKEEMAPRQESEILATVRFNPVEGGCWILESSSGAMEPTTLDEPFRKENLRVAIRVTPLPSAATICQAGRVVRIDSIRISP